MTMSKHTPGPWHVQPSTPHPMIVSHDGTYVARVRMESWFGKGIPATAVRNSFDETMSNAALIAAAPELLANLKEVVEMWRRIYTNEYGTDEEACEHLAPMMATIAKAEGRTP